MQAQLKNIPGCHRKNSRLPVTYFAGSVNPPKHPNPATGTQIFPRNIPKPPTAPSKPLRSTWSIESMNARLQHAATSGDTEQVELLLTKGASIEATDHNCNKNTPLHSAASKGHVSVVKLLSSKGASIEAGDIYNSTPLHVAAANGHVSVVRLLYNKGALIEAGDTYKRTPLHVAAANGHTSVVKLLPTIGASLEPTDIAGNTPLHRAASGGHLDIVKLLLAKDVSIDVQNKNKTTPLESATNLVYTDIVSSLKRTAIIRDLDRVWKSISLNFDNKTPTLDSTIQSHLKQSRDIQQEIHREEKAGDKGSGGVQTVTAPGAPSIHLRAFDKFTQSTPWAQDFNKGNGEEQTVTVPGFPSVNLRAPNKFTQSPPWAQPSATGSGGEGIVKALPGTLSIKRAHGVLLAVFLSVLFAVLFERTGKGAQKEVMSLSCECKTFTFSLS